MLECAMCVICRREKKWNMCRSLSNIAFTTGNILMLWERSNVLLRPESHYCWIVFPLPTHSLTLFFLNSSTIVLLLLLLEREKKPLQIYIYIFPPNNNKPIRVSQVVFYKFRISLNVFEFRTHKLIAEIFIIRVCLCESAYPIVPIQCVYLRMHVIKWRMWNNSSQ